LLYVGFYVSLHPKSKFKERMKQKLQQIASELEHINRDLRREEQVMSEELRDRQAKHLEGEAAINHYNEWMKAAGMEHLMTK
jgi:hypothetical protein